MSNKEKKVRPGNEEITSQMKERLSLPQNVVPTPEKQGDNE